MRILITGGLGFVGTHLEKALHTLIGDEEVYVMDRLRVSRKNYFRGDICDYVCMENIFQEIEPEAVYHFAGMVSRKECEETPLMAIETNVKGTMNVVDLCKRFDSKILYAGSSEEYGAAFDNGVVVTEETPLGSPSSIYSATKRMADDLIHYHATYKHLDAVRFRFFMFYGAGEPATEYRSAITRFFDAAMKGEPLHAHRGTERSWCYIDDGIMAMIAACDKGSGLYNIGRNEPISTVDLANRIIQITNSDSELIIEDPGETIIPVKRASFQKAKRELDWEARIPIAEGLDRVYRSLVNKW